LTGAGDVLGTPSYMAPEQLAGQAVDPRADQFSAATVLFELLSGTKPFHGKSLAESMLNMERRGPSDICALEPKVPPALKQVIGKALAFKAEDRYATCAEFSKAIAGAAAISDKTAVLPEHGEETVFASIGQTPPPLLVQAARSSIGVELLTEVERDLMTFIGPLAKIAVRRSSKTIYDVAALYESLASYIEHPADRASFISKGQQRARVDVRSIAGGAVPRGAQPQRPSTLAVAVTPDLLRRIEGDLTKYLGPIASIVVRKTLSKSTSLPDFYRDLAAYIPDERDRTDFLKLRQRPSEQAARMHGWRQCPGGGRD